jgi:hypothetical protein
MQMRSRWAVPSPDVVVSTEQLRVNAGHHRRSRGGVVTAAALACVVLLAVGIVLVVTGSTANTAASPQRVVAGYFTALQDDDAAKALSFGDLPAGPRALLTADVLAAQRKAAPLGDIRIGAVTTRAKTATVEVTYALGYPGGTKPVTTTVGLHRDGRSWRMNATAVATTLTFSQAGDRALLLGAAVPSGEVLLFPGALPVTFDSDYLTLDPAHAAVDFGTGAAFTAKVDVSDAGGKAIAQAVRRAVTQCLSTRSGSSTCPLPDGAVPGTLRADLTGDVARTVHVTLLGDAAGIVEISGTTGFTGIYDRLDGENVPRTQSGAGTLPLTSWMYVTDPLTVVWGEHP